jgi:pimeloyl-ACP methyl ester carboxylesterase
LEFQRVIRRPEEAVKGPSLVGQLLEEYLPFAPASGPLPDPTPAEGPDPYGNENAEWLQVDWGAHLRRTEIAMPGEPVPDDASVLDGDQMTEVNYVELAPPNPESPITVLFVHGLSGSWQNWLENLPHFARTHRVVALDLPGFGHSPLPTWRISIESYGRLVHRFSQALGIGDCVIVGNSMGGFIGAEIAIQFSTRVDKLVLVSAAGISIEHQRNEPVLHVLERLDDVLILGTGWLATRSAMLAGRPRARRQMMKLVAHRADDLPAPLIAEQVMGSGKPGFVPALDALTDYPIRDRLKEISCPVLVVWGEQDRLVPARDAFVFGELIPNARVVVWPDTGHVAMLERPAAFNALVDEFLAQ